MGRFQSDEPNKKYKMKIVRLAEKALYKPSNNYYWVRNYSACN